MGCQAVLMLLFLVGATHGEMLGKLLFQNTDDHEKSTLNILHKPQSIHLAPNPGPVPSDEVASIIALSLGLSVPKDVKWAGLQINNPFRLSKAALMISVDNIPKGQSLKTSAAASYPVESVDDTTSINDMYYIAPKYSLSNHMNGIFEGESKIVSISGDEHVAGSGHSNSPSSETSVWSELTKSWKVVDGKSDIKTSLSRSDILQRVPDVLSSGFTYHANDHTVRVHTKGLEFSFNLDDDVDFKLFSELVYIVHASKELSAQKSFAKDNTPDLFLISVSALKGLEKKYGATSQHMRGALVLIENIIERTVTTFVKLYGDNIFVVGLTVPSESAYLNEHKDDLKPVLKVLEDNHAMVVDLDNSGSELHLMDKLEAEEQKKLCELVAGSLSQSTNFHFKCARDLPVRKVHKRSLLQLSDAGVENEKDLNLGSDYNDNFPVIFNIWFWLMVILALTVYVVSIGMWNMDPGRDSIIYRLTQQKIKSE